MVLFSKITILDPIMWPHPFKNPNLQNLKNESSRKKLWGLKWSPSPSSMVQYVFVLKDYNLRSHPVSHTPFQNPNPHNFKIESTNVKIWGLKWSSSATSMMKVAFVFWDYHLRPHHVGHHPFKNPNPQNLKIESSKVKTGGLKWSSSPSSMV